MAIKMVKNCGLGLYVNQLLSHHVLAGDKLNKIPKI
jgi:hypothetical protein